MARRKVLIFIVCVTGFFIAGWIYYLARPAGLVVQQYGISFSSKQALALGLNPYTTYLAILDDLGVKKLRLVAYWDVIEPRPGKYNWRELDWQLAEANNRGAKVVLTIGRKLPRWPECFLPKWTNSLSAAEQENRLQIMLVAVVRRYENHPAVIMWQLENEPFVDWFGICFAPDAGVLSRERATIKYFSDKPILITDSGELSWWRQSANFADRFGTTLYRATWNSWLGYSFSPQPAAVYRFKARLRGLDPNKVIISELQAEPWTPGMSLFNTPIDEQMKTMSIKDWHLMLSLAQRTGFSEAYLWGAEWWYWMKLHGRAEYWEAAKKLFAPAKISPGR